MKRIIAITMGDPSGVGPELIAKVATRTDLPKDVAILAVGDQKVFERAASIVAPDVRFERVSSSEISALKPRTPGYIPVLDLANVRSGNFEFGELSSEYGKAAYESLVRAIDLALGRSIDAIVTAPLNKEALHMAGYNYGGHTEILAERTRTRHYAMMLAHGNLRVSHVSTHVSLREATDRVTADRVFRVIELTNNALKRIGIAAPSIAVAGLNPHAGEHGLFGKEEIEHIGPAIERARDAGIDAIGPFPPDTLFPRAVSGEFDAVVVMYHDQGHIPVKLLGFQHDIGTGFSSVQGVNITLGLPIVRTSVDHGTAFDLAGTGKASDESLRAAIEYARMLIGDSPKEAD